MITIGKCSFVYGIIEDKPELPEGWEYVESNNDWLLARTPSGDLYFVEDGEEIVCFRRVKFAKIWDVVRSMGRLKIGQRFMDKSHAYGISREPSRKRVN